MYSDDYPPGVTPYGHTPQADLPPTCLICTRWPSIHGGVTPYSHPTTEEEALMFAPKLSPKAKVEKLLTEARAHEDEAARARERAAALESIPDTDPFKDGASLRVMWRGYTYLLLRIAGHWYSTGRAGSPSPYRYSWAELVDWLVSANVEYIQELTAGPRLWLNETADKRDDEGSGKGVL